MTGGSACDDENGENTNMPIRIINETTIIIILRFSNAVNDDHDNVPLISPVIGFTNDTTTVVLQYGQATFSVLPGMTGKRNAFLHEEQFMVFFRLYN